MKTFFFRQEVFDAMPFGYSASSLKMTLNADHIIESDGRLSKSLTNCSGKVLSPEEIRKWKESWDGIIVSAPSL